MNGQKLYLVFKMNYALPMRFDTKIQIEGR